MAIHGATYSNRAEVASFPESLPWDSLIDWILAYATNDEKDIALPQESWNPVEHFLVEQLLSRKGAKAQRKAPNKDSSSGFSLRLWFSSSPAGAPDYPTIPGGTF